MAIVLLCAGGCLSARAQTTFPLLSRFRDIGATVTPAQYPAILKAFEAAITADGDNWMGAPPAQVAERAAAQAVNLGPLGTGYVFDGVGPCGATGNCNITFVYPKRGGGLECVLGFGYGWSLVPVAGGPPEIYFFNNMSAATGGIGRMRYNGTQYVDDGGEGYRMVGDEEHPTMTPVPDDGKPAFPIPAWRESPFGEAASISLDDYNLLRAPALAALGKMLSPAQAEAAFDGAHALQYRVQDQDAVIVLQAAHCDGQGNCPLLLFHAHLQLTNGDANPLPQSMTLLMAPVSGANAAVGSYFMDRGPNPGTLVAEATVATRTSPTAALLRHFRETPADRFGPQRFAPDICATVSGAAGNDPAAWAGSRLTPVACATPPPPAGALPLDPARVGNAVQDRDGALWATGSPGGDLPCGANLYRWDGRRWRLQPQPAGKTVADLVADPRGGVDVTWEDCPGETSRTWFHDNQSTPLPGIEPQPPAYAMSTPLGLLVLAGGTRMTPAHVWAPGEQPGLGIWQPAGPPRRVFTFDTSQLSIRMNPAFPPSTGALHAVTDSQGRAWIWGDGFTHGVVLVTKTGVQTVATIPGLPDARILRLSPWDDGQLAATTVGEGLYAISPAMQAAPIAEPAPGAFHSVQQIFAVHGARYVLAAPAPAMPRGFSVPALWRWSHGAWEDVIPQLYAPLAGSYGVVWAATSRGIWTSAGAAGMWYVPDDGAGMRLSWKNGLPVSGGVDQILALSGDRVFVHSGAGSTEFSAAKVLAAKPAAPDFTIAPITGTLAKDTNGTVWGLESGALAAWDGHAFSPHPFPAAVQRGHLSGAAVDSQGRIWTLPNCSMGPGGIFNPATGAWVIYRDYRNALVRQAAALPFAKPLANLTPQAGPNGQLAFFGPCGGLNYFDGERWRLWNLGPLLRQMPGDGPDSQPGFAPDGSLILNIANGHGGSVTWRWSGTTWETTTAQALPPRASPFNATPPLPAPPIDCATPWPESLAFDSSGLAWWTAGGRLYRGTDHACHVVLPASEIQPFLDGRGLLSVALGPSGAALVQMTIGGYIAVNGGS